MLDYDTFKSAYPKSELSEIVFNQYKTIVLNKIKNYSVYKLENLSKDKQQEIKDYIALQIDYFEKEGLYSEGIVSQSTLSVSTSYNADSKQGDCNFSGLFLDWLKNSGLGSRVL